MRLNINIYNVVIVPGLVPVMFTYVGSNKMAFICVEATHLKRYYVATLYIPYINTHIVALA